MSQETPTPDVDLSLPSEDLVLAQAHQIRQKVIDELMPNGKIPKDDKQIKMLMEITRDMEHTAISRKRIKVDDDTNNVEAQRNALALAILEQSSKRRSQRRQESVAAQNSTVPQLPSSIPPPTLVEGETSVGWVQEDHASFMKRVNV